MQSKEFYSTHKRRAVRSATHDSAEQHWKTGHANNSQHNAYDDTHDTKPLLSANRNTTNKAQNHLATNTLLLLTIVFDFLRTVALAVLLFVSSRVPKSWSSTKINRNENPNPLTTLALSLTQLSTDLQQHCLDCGVEFSVRARILRHRCPNCGNDFCRRCVLAQTHARFEKSNKHKEAVCAYCFFALCARFCRCECYSSLPVRTLKRFLSRKEIDIWGAVEKQDLVEKIKLWVDELGHMDTLHSANANELPV